MGAANESVISLSEAAKPIEVEEAYPEVAEAGAAPLDFVEDICVETDASAPTDLPYWACTYCNIHSPASVVKCAATGKWFCNSKVPGLPASCIIYHLVRSKHNEVVLHKESPLGEITLECFLTGTKNVFQLGAPRPVPPRPAPPSPPDHACTPAPPRPDPTRPCRAHAPPRPPTPRPLLPHARASARRRLRPCQGGPGCPARARHRGALVRVRLGPEQVGAARAGEGARAVAGQAAERCRGAACTPLQRRADQQARGALAHQARRDTPRRRGQRRQPRRLGPCTAFRAPLTPARTLTHPRSHPHTPSHTLTHPHRPSLPSLTALSPPLCAYVQAT